MATPSRRMRTPRFMEFVISALGTGRARGHSAGRVHPLLAHFAGEPVSNPLSDQPREAWTRKQLQLPHAAARPQSSALAQTTLGREATWPCARVRFAAKRLPGNEAARVRSLSTRASLCVADLGFRILASSIRDASDSFTAARVEDFPQTN